MEAGAFPSDQYALETQARYHGLNPEVAIVEVAPRPGEEILHTEDIVAAIETHGPQTALVLFGGVNYYTGQYYDLQAITDAGHKVGAYVGFDLAHAAGNLPLHLHDWDADFAVWCSYKYLNSGPGGPGGVFVHERHGANPDLPRFAGWWGHDENSRFLMRKGFHPMPGAAGWQLSNAQILSFAAHKASLDIFLEAGITNLREKSLKLTGYLEFILHHCIEQGQNLRCQLSVRTGANGRRLFDYLAANAVLCDWREDNLSGEPGGVIRISPAPLYNGFSEVYEVGRLLAGFSG
jgi:kynureninase